MKTISLDRGYSTVVDDEDYQSLIGFPWYAKGSGSHVYACMQSAGGRDHRFEVKMHQMLLAVAPGMEVDHINRDKLDNRLVNLRPATRSQNMQNKGPLANNTSGYKGVSLVRATGKWQATIKPGPLAPQVCLGAAFETKEDAARAYDAAARRFHGEFAYLNFP